MIEKVLIVGALGALGYLYLEEERRAEEEGLAEGTSCGPLARLVEDENGKRICDPKLKCKEGYVLSQDMTQCFSKDNPCGPGFKMKDDGQCEIQDSICGDPCYKLNSEKDNCVKISGCGTATGSEIGDVALYLGETIALGYIYDYLGRKVMKVVDRKLAQEAAKKASLEAAKKAANTSAAAVAKGGAKATGLATKRAGQILASRTATVVAKKTALAVAMKAAKKLVAKIAIQAAKIASSSSTVIGVLATPFMILSMSLTIGLTAAGVFFEAPPGTKGWEEIPEGAKVAITAIPVIGDLIDIASTFVYASEVCAQELVEQNSLCYEPPKPDFNCEAFLCPAKPDHMPGYNAGNFMGATMFHLTKKILTDTGTIPNKCPPGKMHGMESTDAAPGFCYDIQGDPGRILMGVWWEDCKPGERDDGAFCAKEHIDPCGPGEWEVGRDCWGNRVDNIIDCITKPASGGDCKRWGVNNCSWSPGTCARWGCHQCTDFGLLGRSCITNHACCAQWGQELCTMNHAQCAEWNPLVGCGTTAINMPELRRTFAARNFRFESRPKASRVLAPHGNLCPDHRSHEAAGLCYPNDQQMPPGYRRKAYGTLEPDCPGSKEEWRKYENYKDTVDIGVSCQLPTYTRPPYPKLHFGLKKRVVIEDQPDPPLPPLCSTLPVLPETDPQYKQRLCREKDPAPGFALSDDGFVFYKKCKELFSFNFETTNCDWINDNGETESYPNADGLEAVEFDFV
jgi:hypothetical protein